MINGFGAILRDVLIQKKAGAYAEWRTLTDSLLSVTNTFATQPEDIARFIQGKPLNKDYVVAKNILGDLRKSKNSQALPKK